MKKIISAVEHCYNNAIKYSNQQSADLLKQIDELIEDKKSWIAEFDAATEQNIVLRKKLEEAMQYTPEAYIKLKAVADEMAELLQDINFGIANNEIINRKNKALEQYNKLNTK